MVSLVLPVFGRVVNRAFMHAVFGGVACDVSTAENHTLPIMEEAS